jgi:hypothetical protein
LYGKENSISSRDFQTSLGLDYKTEKKEREGLPVTHNPSAQTEALRETCEGTNVTASL